MTILVIAEHDNASLMSATLHAITAAKQLGGDVHVLVAGHNAGAAAQAAAAVAGVATLFLAAVKNAWEVAGSDAVAVLYLMDANGQRIRQLCFDQDHNWCPTVMNDGKVLYQR